MTAQQIAGLYQSSLYGVECQHDRDAERADAQGKSHVCRNDAFKIRNGCYGRKMPNRERAMSFQSACRIACVQPAVF